MMDKIRWIMWKTETTSLFGHALLSVTGNLVANQKIMHIRLIITWKPLWYTVPPVPLVLLVAPVFPSTPGTLSMPGTLSTFGTLSMFSILGSPKKTHKLDKFVLF